MDNIGKLSCLFIFIYNIIVILSGARPQVLPAVHDHRPRGVEGPPEHREGNWCEAPTALAFQSPQAHQSTGDITTAITTPRPHQPIVNPCATAATSLI